MRVCVIQPDLSMHLLDEEGLDLKRLTRRGTLDNSSNGAKLHFLSDHFGYLQRKTRYCRKSLRLITLLPWIPQSLAAIPLYWSEEEVIETFWGFDPDVVVCSGVRWGRLLKRLLGRYFPHWAFLTYPGERIEIPQSWRKYDPSCKVSIVLPTYNGSKYIRQSIDSCLNQTFRNIELVVVDDGSHQDIRSILSCYTDSRIKYLRHERNLGLPHALNTGFKHCSGQYLTWTSDDNYYSEKAIEEMVRFLQTYTEVNFVYAQSHLIDERSAPEVSGILKILPPQRLTSINRIGPCFLYTRKVYEVIGEYDARASLAEDYDYWVRVSKHFKMQRLFMPLYYYRYHDDSLTSKSSREEVLEQVKRVKQLNNGGLHRLFRRQAGRG